MRTLDDYINQVTTLPPAPRTLTEAMALLKRDDADASQIVNVIAFDPALTAKVLQRCNNVEWSGGRAVSDLDEAVVRVGFNEIYRLVAVVVGEGMLSAPQPGYGIGAGELWQHSVTCAIAARAIAKKLGGDENIVFTAALLHDIGKMVLGGFLEDASGPLLAETGPSGNSFLEAEKSILGVEHAEVGGRVLTRWNFPDALVSGVWHHHNPARAAMANDIAAYVHLGDYIAHCLGAAGGLNSFAVRGRPEALEILEIAPREIEGLIVEADTALREASWFVPLRV